MEQNYTLSDTPTTKQQNQLQTPNLSNSTPDLCTTEKQDRHILISQPDANVFHAASGPTSSTCSSDSSRSVYSQPGIKLPGADNLSHSFARSITQLSVFVCVLMTMANISCFSAYYHSTHARKLDMLALPNGDHVSECQDKPRDKTCFEMHDFEGKTLYRSEGAKRVLALYKCNPRAHETEQYKCVGEYAFSHNSTLIWFHRLYWDKFSDTYSLVSGPDAPDSQLLYPRIRHMLDKPYNWVIGYEHIPSNDFPHSSLYVKGKVVVDHDGS